MDTNEALKLMHEELAKDPRCNAPEKMENQPASLAWSDEARAAAAEARKLHHESVNQVSTKHVTGTAAAADASEEAAKTGTKEAHMKAADLHDRESLAHRADKYGGHMRIMGVHDRLASTHRNIAEKIGKPPVTRITSAGTVAK